MRWGDDEVRDNTKETAHTAIMNATASAPRSQPLSPIRRMQDLPIRERRKVMATAAEALADYYRTDPEIKEWQALDGEDFCDIDNETA